ncbi:uncharacterized protein DNG_07337 [Cephalotrichum gorgonifer]|uniref:DUF2264 domain-containing protein n=1 Tax=Cephalotrichum gorgonifer TaxID=2041049 RepID=A0AAE8SY42_9PEZI|nr:uncharacterized protein DNG_07337 [Cephalotrichum gorgonifer]
MPPLPGFTSNPLRTRADLVRAASALIGPLAPHKSPAKARIRFPFQTATGFDEIAAQLEGFARPLFVVAPLLLHDRDTDDALDETLGLSSWIEGVAAGVDPESPEYWGEIDDSDQRMVETESIAYALMLAPDVFLSGMDELVRGNLVSWLRGIHGKRMPVNNWRWFRVFVNLALVKTLGVPQEEVQEEIESDLAILDSFYLGEGWSSDGVWGEERSQADYYSGSFAIQFAQLLFVRFTDGNEYEERVWRYKAQAREFSSKFWRFFDPDGAAIPFGRSMIYRFAFAAFWAAAVLAQVDLGPPLSLGAVKGLLLRHLRWWAHEDRAEMFHAGGTLTIGFAYPNMYMAEDYNSPQSPYWCLKSLVVLALPPTDNFWAIEEENYPLVLTWSGESPSSLAPESTVIWPPRQIIVNDPFHTYLLSSGQSTTRPFKGREAKYGKFAYSSTFGFSVPTGPLLHQTAPDSTLAIQFSHDDWWRTRSSPEDVHLVDISIGGSGGKHVTGLMSTWKPRSHLRSFEIETTLIPPLASLPGWHIRVHRVRGSSAGPDPESFSLVDGGFATASSFPSGYFIPELRESGMHEDGWVADCASERGGALVISPGGTSGVVDLTSGLVGQQGSTDGTMMPFVRHDLELSTDDNTRDRIFVTGVFAVKMCADLDRGEARVLWRKRPVVKLGHGGKLEVTVSVPPA